jgi:CheY-like chemotaxis protein
MAQKILIIEDDAYNRDVFTQLIQTEGYEVETASDGLTGLEKMQKGGYNLVIMDIMLPKLDGFEILTALKKNPAWQPNGGVMLLTNLAKEKVHQEAMNLGAIACYNKTDVSPSELLKIVRDLTTPKH